MLQSQKLNVWRIRQRPDGRWVVEEQFRTRDYGFKIHPMRGSSCEKTLGPWLLVWEQKDESFRSRRRARKAALRYKNPKIEII